DGAVRPAAEQRANEPLGFAVGLWPVGAGAQVADPERPAGDRVNRSAVRGPVIGQDALDSDSVPGEELDRSSEERDHGGRLVVWQHLGVGEAGAVIDGDVDVLPAGDLAPDPKRVPTGGPASPVCHPDDAGAGAALDPSQLLDVDV